MIHLRIFLNVILTENGCKTKIWMENKWHQLVLKQTEEMIYESFTVFRKFEK